MEIALLDVDGVNRDGDFFRSTFDFEGLGDLVENLTGPGLK